MVESLKTDIANSKKANEKIGTMITKTQALYDKVHDLKQKISNPVDSLKDMTSDLTSKFFRRLEDSGNILQQLDDKIKEGKANQKSIATALDASEQGITAI